MGSTSLRYSFNQRQWAVGLPGGVISQVILPFEEKGKMGLIKESF